MANSADAAVPQLCALHDRCCITARNAGTSDGTSCPGEGDDGLDMEEMQGYSAAYAKLANASKAERPVLAEIADPKQYLESSLARVMAAGPR